MYRAWMLSLCAAALLGGLPARAASLEAYSFSAAGESSCGTFGSTTQVNNTIFVSSLEVSTPGPGCGVTLNLQDLTAAAGLLNASTAASGASNTAFGAFSYSGSSQSRAGFNTLGVQALGSLSGATDGLTDIGSEAFADMIDGFTVPGAAGQSGYLRFDYSLDGTQTIDGRGAATLELLWRENGDPQFLAFRAQNDSSFSPSVNINGAYVSSSPDIVITPTQITVNTSQSFTVPINFNETFFLNLVLYGSAIPGPSTGLPGASSVDNQFLGTVTLTGFDVFNSVGQQIAGAQVIRDSAAIPEPGGMLLAETALGALILLRRSKRPIAYGTSTTGARRNASFRVVGTWRSISSSSKK